jgi:hypothetical protein
MSVEQPDYTENAESTLRRMSGEPARDDRERLSWAIDDHAVAVMAAMRDREGPFGARLAQAKAALLSAVDACTAAGGLVAADVRCRSCDHVLDMHQCTAEYERPGGRQRGDRIVRCHLQAGHPGEHEEDGTDVTWIDTPVSTPEESRSVADWWPGTIDPDDPDHDDQCEAEFISGPMAYSPCRCAERAGLSQKGDGR